jgi:4-amino-4-deoxy-L-arabinose transferase-like glycosyltransferase
MFRYVADKFLSGALPQSILAATGTSGIAWRDVIPTLYFGKADPNGPAWHYPFVMTLITMPAAALLGAVGSAFAGKRAPRARPLLALLWWSVLVQLAIFAFIAKPYDGVRLFLPAVALSTLAAGIGLASIAAKGRWALAAATALLVVSPGAEVFIYGPYELSYYTPLVGGLPGADRLGFEATYYGEAIDAAGFAAINDRASPGQKVAYAPMFKKNPLWMPANYIKYTFLKAGLAPVAPWKDWDYLIFINRGGSIEPADRDLLAQGTVIHENRLLGVMLSEILERRRNLESPSIPAP